MVEEEEGEAVVGDKVTLVTDFFLDSFEVVLV